MLLRCDLLVHVIHAVSRGLFGFDQHPRNVQHDQEDIFAPHKAQNQLHIRRAEESSSSESAELNKCRLSQDSPYYDYAMFLDCNMASRHTRLAASFFWVWIGSGIIALAGFP